MNVIQQLLTEHLDIWTAAETEKKSGRGRSSGNAASVYGIKKLRDLILELAVRGKLVPQDANDEPASALLKRIQAEKTKLIADGKIKKDKPLASISEKDKLFELPPGWEWHRLNTLCILENGDRGKNYPNKSVLVEAGIPFVNAGHLQNGLIDKNQMTFITKERFDILRGGKFQENDILFCLRGSLGKSALVKEFEEGAIASSLVIIRLFPNLDATYFVNYFDCPLCLKMIKKYDNGTAQPNLSSTDLAKFLVPLPPLAEQHRIVAKVDELMALCDQLETQHSNAVEAHEKLVSHLLGTLTLSQSTVSPLCKRGAGGDLDWQRIAAHFDTLFTTEASIEVLKQTLLQLAVMGKLVPQDANDEPASELLKRIQAEKAKLVAEGKIKKDKPLAPITDEEKPFELPESWKWVQLGSISEFINGDRGANYPNRSEYVNDGIPWINTGHIEPDGTLTKLEMNYISREKFNSLNGGKIQLGDLVYCLRGATFGKTAIVDPYFEGAIASSLMIIRPSVYLSKEFIFRYLVSPTGKSQIFRFDNGSAQPNLSANNVKLYVFPLPPISEQHRIIAKVDELMAICDQLKLRLTEAKQLQQKLADVLVEQAIS